MLKIFDFWRHQNPQIANPVHVGEVFLHLFNADFERFSGSNASICSQMSACKKENDLQVGIKFSAHFMTVKSENPANHGFAGFSQKYIVHTETSVSTLTLKSFMALKHVLVTNNCFRAEEKICRWERFFQTSST